MEESCILTYKKPQKLRLLKSNIPPSQVKSTIYYKILVDLTLIRQGDVIHVLTRKKWFWMTIIWCVYCNLYEKL